MTNLVRKIRFEADQLAKPSQAATHDPLMMDDGKGMPTVLAHLATMRDGRLEQIEHGLRLLVPGFKRVHVFPTEVTWQERSAEAPPGQGTILRDVKGGGYRLELEFDREGRIDAHHVSEGTMLALGLLTFLTTESSRTIMIDDAERGLHPVAQQKLIRNFRQLLDQYPDLQLILTTHSPDLVNACEPHEIRVFGRDASGSTVVRALDSHQNAAKWLKMMRTGEFWSTVGEDWVGESAAGTEATG
ncbi:MAG: AAA family ATPase [Myxococcota bacterium]